MTPSVCEVCGRPATVHETWVRNKRSETRHLCVRHAAAPVAAAERALKPGAAGLAAAAESFLRLSPAERRHLALLDRLTRRFR